MRSSPFFPGISRIAAGVVLLLAASGNVQAACYTNSHALPAVAINSFTSNPIGVLGLNPTGGGRLIAQIRDLAASDPATLPLILSLVTNSNNDQKSAIGAGLAQAARLCVRADPAYAAQIQQAIAQTGDQALIVAYSAAAGDQPIAAVAPAGVALSGGATGQTTPFGAPAGGFGASPITGGGTSNPFLFSFTGNTTGASGGPSGRRSVSP